MELETNDFIGSPIASLNYDEVLLYQGFTLTDLANNLTIPNYGLPSANPTGD